MKDKIIRVITLRGDVHIGEDYEAVFIRDGAIHCRFRPVPREGDRDGFSLTVVIPMTSVDSYTTENKN